MTQQEAKVAQSADDTVGNHTSVSGHENGPGKAVPVKTEHDPDKANAVGAERPDVIGQGATAAATYASAGDLAPMDDEKLQKPANGDSKPAEEASQAAEAASAAANASTALAATSDKRPAAKLPAAKVEGEREQQPSTATDEVHTPTSERNMADNAGDEAAGPLDAANATVADSAEEEKADALTADPPPANGRAEREDPKEADIQPDNSVEASSLGEHKPSSVEEDKRKPSEEDKLSTAEEEQLSSVEEKPSPAEENKPSAAEEDELSTAEEQLSSVEKPSPAEEDKPSTTKAAMAKATEAEPKPVQQSMDGTSTIPGTPAVSSPKGTPVMTPPGTVQALSRRLSSNSLSTPSVKSTPSDKLLTSGGAGSGSAVQGVATGGRSTKSPAGAKSGEASPVSTHDTKNTINVSQLLKAGAFKMQPQKDFVPYDELLRLRVEDGIDATRKEDYLNDEDFQTVFGMERDAFKKLPAWRQAQAKKKANLF